jgi:tyrosyl-DNA phosphodiesterase-1
MNEATCNTKLVKLSNFECGVVIPGELVESLLEPGTESWQSGIVPYVQTGKRYDLPKDRPWNGKNNPSLILLQISPKSTN